MSICDSGPGVAPGDEQDIFKPFKTTKKQGTGLGLAISQAIVKEHGGHIELDKGPMDGARFTVTIPIGAPAGREPERT